VYDAKRRTARLARSVWNDAARAEQLERQAEALKRRFNEGCWGKMDAFGRARLIAA
jgi:hypothetical protein